MTTADVRQQAIEWVKSSEFSYLFENRQGNGDNAWDSLSDGVLAEFVDALIAAGLILETDNTGDDAKPMTRGELIDAVARVVHNYAWDDTAWGMRVAQHQAKEQALNAATRLYEGGWLVARSSGVADPDEVRIKCARCGRPMIAQTDDPEPDNDAMEVCSGCSWEVATSTPVDVHGLSDDALMALEKNVFDEVKARLQGKPEPEGVADTVKEEDGQ